MGSVLLWEFVSVAVIGCLVAVGEIINRYRDSPWFVVRSPSAIAYTAINGLAAMAALALAKKFGWDFSPADATTYSTASYSVSQVLTAGFGAMAVFRSAVFNIRVGSEDVGVGPSSVLKIILDSVDRNIDRDQARVRAKKVASLMANVSFSRAQVALPAFCLALMQNLPAEDQAILADEIKTLSESTQIDDPVRVQLLGLSILNQVGPDVLEAGVEALEKSIADAS